jgi:serine/threonine-protein kinase
MNDFAPGATIDGRYRVRSRIGTGGMADVYLVHDEQLGREVALKVLHQRFAADPAFVERFRREAQSAAALAHPHVVSVYDRGSFDDNYYIAMEYLPGRSLKQLIQEEAPLQEGRAIKLATQILQATAFAHRHGVIHRDLKPHNVIVDAEDNVKVTDFGIARAGASDMTETGSIMGTAQYLSPEQAQGHAVSGPSDLYSVGVILYEMMTGRVPFEGDSPVAIALKQVAEAPVPPSQLNPSISPDLEQVILWALNKNPADRPADADRFIEALEQVASGAPGQTTSMRALSAGTSGAGLMAAAAAATAYGSAANLAAADGNGDGAGDDEDGEREARSKKRRKRAAWIIAAIVLALAVAAGLFFLLRPTKAEMPSVTGYQLSNAETKLEAAGFENIATPTSQTNSATKNTVIGQRPLAKQKVSTSTTIHLIISSGPQLSKTVMVPQVLGDTQAQAIKAIDDAGLSVAGVKPEASATVPKGQATRTSPATGTPLARDGGVTLFISSGPPTTTTSTTAQVRVANVVGNLQATAQSTLSDQGLSYTIKNVTTNSVASGTVVSQSPVAGTKVATGASVTLTIAQSANQVPNVVGDGEAAAVSTVQAAGYRVRITYRNVSNSSKNGLVLSQSPRANATAKADAVVTLVIGTYVSTNTGTGTTTTSTVVTTVTSSISGVTTGSQ